MFLASLFRFGGKLGAIRVPTTVVIVRDEVRHAQPRQHQGGLCRGPVKRRSPEHELGFNKRAHVAREPITAAGRRLSACDKEDLGSPGGFGAGNGVTAGFSADAGSSFASMLLSRFIRGESARWAHFDNDKAVAEEISPHVLKQLRQYVIHGNGAVPMGSPEPDPVPPPMAA
jgi:hypothetical protein